MIPVYIQQTISIVFIFVRGDGNSRKLSDYCTHDLYKEKCGHVWLIYQSCAGYISHVD